MFFYLIGVVTFITWLYKAFNFINIYFLQWCKFRRCQKDRPDGTNPWALVTEVTSTVGLSFAHEIASRGFNVVLQGSDKKDLDRIKSDYEKQYPICSFMTLVAEPSAVDGVDFEAIKNQLESLNLTVFINNIGGRTEETGFGLLNSFSRTRTAQNISAKITFPVLLTTTILPILRRNSPSLIITVGSTQDQAIPLLTTHAASMAFHKTMSESLALEAKMVNDDVEVINVSLGKPAGARGRSFWRRSVDESVKAALARAWCGRTSLEVHWFHALANIMASLLPRGFVEEGIVIITRKKFEDAMRRRDIISA